MVQVRWCQNNSTSTVTKDLLLLLPCWSYLEGRKGA